MQSFLEGPKSALVASKDFDEGHYLRTPQHGIRAFGRVYSAWAYGQTVCSRCSDQLYSSQIPVFSGIENTSTCTRDSASFASPSFFVTQLLTKIRFSNLETFLRERWELGFLKSWDANDLLTLLKTWQMGDVSQVRDGGDLEKCLSAIKARGLIMPSKTDLYFAVRNYKI
jgi:homoserine acetyltransferase